MDRSTRLAIIKTLSNLIFDIADDGKINSPATASQSLRDIADEIERANPEKR